MHPAPETALVPFHGHQLLTLKDGDTLRVAMKPICEAIGLDWKGQYNRIQRHPVLSTCMVIMTIQVPGDVQGRETVTLPLDYLNGWLFGVDARRVREEIRDRLIDYQRECFAALAAYWQQGVATNPRARAATIPQLLATQRHAMRLMQALKAETLPAARQVLHTQLQQACRLLAMPCPDLGEIGADAPPDHESPVIDAFWELMDLLLDERDTRKLNHARMDGLLAINLPQAYGAAHAAKLATPEINALRRVLRHSREPRFIGTKPVNSRHASRTVKCWVFDLSGESAARGHGGSGISE